MRNLLFSLTALLLCLPAYGAVKEEASVPRKEDTHWNFGAGGRYSRYFGYIADELVARNGYPKLEISVGRNTFPSDSSRFDRAFNFPNYGLGFAASLWENMPQRKPTGKYGNMYDLFGFFETDFIRWDWFSIGLKGHFGVGYTGVTHHPETNPDNIWTGGHFNIYYGMGPAIRFYPHPQWEIGIDAMIWHHSNGRVHMPNSGINEFGVALTTRYYMDAPYRGNSWRMEKDGEPYRKRFVWSIFGGAEPYTSDALYDVYTLETKEVEKDPSYKRTFSWPLKPAVRAQIGADFLWKYARIAATGITVQAMYASNIEDLKRADRKLCELNPEVYSIEDIERRRYSPFYFGVGITQEVQYRRVIVFATVGIHIGREMGAAEELRRTLFYQSLGGRYLIPGLDGTYVAFACKVRYFSRADNLEFTIGKRF